MLKPMINPDMELLSTVAIAASQRLAADPDDAEAWTELQSAIEATKDDGEELALAVEVRDADELRRIADGWAGGAELLPACDRAVLKRAMKAFRKTLKVTRLAAETRLGGGPFSAGSDSTVVGCQPPQRYPMAVWMELVRQGRLATDRRGTFELPPGEQ